MGEQEFGAGPTLILFINTLIDGNADVFEPDFVDFMFAAQRDDRADGDARRFHVDQQEADAFLLLRIGIGANKEEAPVGMLRHGGPGFLAIDDIMIAITHGFCAQRSEVGTGAGLRITLTPPVIARQDAGKEAGLLLGRAEGIDNGADHRQAEGHGADAIGSGQFFRPDEALRRGPAGAAIFDGPCRGNPALFRKNAVPGQEIFFRKIMAFILHRAQVIRVIFGDEATYFLLEGDFFGTEFQLHGDSPLKRLRGVTERLRKRQLAHVVISAFLGDDALCAWQSRKQVDIQAATGRTTIAVLGKLPICQHRRDSDATDYFHIIGRCTFKCRGTRLCEGRQVFRKKSTRQEYDRNPGLHP